MSDSPVPGDGDSTQSNDALAHLHDCLGDSSTELLYAVLEMAQDGGQMVAVKDMHTWRYVYVNGPMAEFLEHPADDVIGRTDADMIEPLRAAALGAADHDAAAQECLVRMEHRFEVRGARREFSASRLPVRQRDGSRPRLQLSMWTDTTHDSEQEGRLRAALQQLEAEQSAHASLPRELADPESRDQTTGLYDHEHFLTQLRREVDLSTREHREFSLVTIALDVLDDRARAAGETGRRRILEAMGRLLRGNTRVMDASCRLGDERFGVLLSGVGLAVAHSRMDGLRRQCAAQIVVHDGQEIGFTVSMGVSSFPHTASTQEELVQAAEKALTLAAARGNYVSLASIALG